MVVMLDVVLVVVVVLLLAAVGVAGWLLVQRGRLLARVAQAEAMRDAAVAAQRETDRRQQADIAALRDELAQRHAALEQASDQIRDLTAECSGLDAKVSQLEERRRDDLASAQRQHDAALAARDQQYQRDLAAADALASEKLAAAERIAIDLQTHLKQAETKFRETFATLAGEALRTAQSQFIQQASATFDQQRQALAAKAGGEIDQKNQAFTALAQQMADRLSKTDATLKAVDTLLNQQSSTITERLRAVEASSGQLREETARLVKALREPQIRGRYGEVQLRRVAELAGMRAYCDFVEQDSTVDEQGVAKRPDMIVRLPNGRELVVDAKANLKPYLDAMEAPTPEEAEQHLRAFADGVVAQAKKLGGKQYWKDYRGSPEFVVMFVPGDQFMDAALSRRPDLLEATSQQRVILASPATLIAMLQAVAVGFREQRLSETAREIGEHVRVLRERMGVMFGHIQKVGERLGMVVGSYNEAVGSFERRVRPQFDKIAQADGLAAGLPGAPGADADSSRALPEIKPIESQIRGSTTLFETPSHAALPAPGTMDTPTGR
jgi:DNA recombination protein RmuC